MEYHPLDNPGIVVYAKPRFYCLNSSLTVLKSTIILETTGLRLTSQSNSHAHVNHSFDCFSANRGNQIPPPRKIWRKYPPPLKMLGKIFKNRKNSEIKVNLTGFSLNLALINVNLLYLGKLRLK